MEKNMGKLRSRKPGSPNFRPNPPIKKNIFSSHAAPVQRPAMAKPVRGASVNRAIARQIRRNNFQQATQEAKILPRFVVRPINPVVKIMPKTPQPAGVMNKPYPMPSINSPSVKKKTAVKPTTGPIPMQSGAGRPVKKPNISTPLRDYQRSKGLDTSTGMALGAAALAGLVINVALANPQISPETNSLNSSLEDIKTRSSLSKVSEEVNRLENDLIHALDLLESARREGYVYQKDLEEIAYKAMDKWQEIKPDILANIPQQAEEFQKKLLTLRPQVIRVNNTLSNPISAAPVIRDASTQVNNLSSEINQIENALESRFSDIRGRTGEITVRLNLIHWGMDQLNQAKFTLADSEDLIHAVQARWDQEGDQDPEGVLYLTNKRMIFERKEKIATKKILFITTASEFIQEVLIDQKIETCRNEKAIHKGLFGNQDFLLIRFSDTKLGDISFHLNGQDCNLWVTWIQKAKSGEIDSDRSSGSGISFTDITGPLTNADILSIQTEVNALQDVISLKEVREELSNLESDMRALERNLVGLRARGYLIEKNLETDIKVLSSQWDRIKENTDKALQNQMNLLSENMEQIQENMALLMAKSSNLSEARPLFLQIKSAMASTEAQADAADDAVMVMYDQYADEVESMSAHFEWVAWMLDAIATASFKLLATESGIAATEATYKRPNLDPENGILFLTDQRLLWEDRVDNYELKVNLPLNQIDEVNLEEDSKNNTQSLLFELSNAAPFPQALFSLASPIGDAWVKMISRACSGEYTKDRAIEIDPKELERIKNAPRQCSNCGAGFTAPILRGQSDLICEYCGQVTRI
jgi:hypothetical protein